MTTYKDERRESIEEMRSETRQEREMFAMTAILEGDCMDRLSQMFDFDGFEKPANDALEAALKAESEEEIGDWDGAQKMASAVIDEYLSEMLDDLNENRFAEQQGKMEHLLGIEAENTGGNVMCFVFHKGTGTEKKSLYFGWSEIPLGYSLMDFDCQELDSGFMERFGDYSAEGQVAFIRKTLAENGFEQARF